MGEKGRAEKGERVGKGGEKERKKFTDGIIEHASQFSLLNDKIVNNNWTIERIKIDH